jgi:KaiC/GvpD/RAD55 family RecA-like ATPase
MDPSAVPSERLAAVPGFPMGYPNCSVLIVGPTGGGRSSFAQACLYDAARAGLRCAYLGSEVGVEEFNARAADLAGRRGDTISDELRAELARVRYLDLPAVIVAAASRDHGA